MTQCKQTSVGFPLPLGASITSQGVNFAVFSKNAQQLYLCLFNAEHEEVDRLPFTERTDDIWHIEVMGLKEGQLYGLRADGLFEPQSMHFFNINKLLIDPYTKSLSTGLTFHSDQISLTNAGTPDTQDSAHCVPKSIVRSVQAKPHTRPTAVSGNHRCVYEMHIKGFSQQLDIEPRLQGTYLGACSEPAIRHLKQLGITTIQLLPCFAFADEIHLMEKELTNYWGYNPINFFTPDSRYAVNDAVDEFQTMIANFHEAGFEVIIDVVYNHTAESELNHGTTCYRGLDNAVYYRHNQNQYLNYTGCGNCVDTYHPAGIRLICDSMRYWVDIMGVDGFRFDLGVDLGREAHDFSPNAPLLHAILQDPILSKTTLIMEPWDIGPNGYQVGQFPNGFMECNDKYRDTVRRFWRGDSDVVPEFATRIMGSRDVFHKGNKSALHSVNYITYHDGYTLRDLVSYHDRHNLANRENNRDGHGDNISQNFGVEGGTENTDILEKRLVQQRCFIATLLLSQGTPHFLGGDELSNSQQGNNNAYCQDNSITWLDWRPSKEQQTLTQDISTLLALRKQYPILAEAFLPDDPLYHHKKSDHIEWFNASGQPMSAEDWSTSDQTYLSLTLTDGKTNTKLWLIFYRADKQQFVTPPSETCIDTLLYSTGGYNLSDQKLTLETRSVSLFALK